MELPPLVFETNLYTIPALAQVFKYPRIEILAFLLYTVNVS